MHREVEPGSFGEPLPGGILRWYALIKTSVSAGDLKRDSKQARTLRAHFWSNQNAAHAESFEWVHRWPGTQGGGRALRFSWPSGVGSVQPVTFADLLDKRVIGGWEDLHCIDRDGLLVFTVTHERMIVRRMLGTRSGPGSEQVGQGEPVPPEFVERLIRRAP